MVCVCVFVKQQRKKLTPEQAVKPKRIASMFIVWKSASHRPQRSVSLFTGLFPVTRFIGQSFKTVGKD